MHARPIKLALVEHSLVSLEAEGLVKSASGLFAWQGEQANAYKSDAFGEVKISLQQRAAAAAASIGMEDMDLVEIE